MSFVNSFDNDVYSKEEAAEEAAMNKTLYMPMKTWYLSISSTMFNEKYGTFPTFWQDLAEWTHLKTIKKLYLKVSDLKNSGIDYDIDQLDASLENGAGNSVVQVETNDPSITNLEQSISDTKETERQKKRKSRWGDDSANKAYEDINHTSSDIAESKQCFDQESDEAKTNPDVPKPRKSRFAAVTAPEAPVLTQESIQQSLILQMQLAQINERLPKIAAEAAIIDLDPNRSPSPPPRYDGNGKRTNTRVDRMREQLTKDKNALIEHLLKINPHYLPPVDFVKTKPSRKLYVPIKEYPTYNFIGLVIGPRGNTQKKMELETNTRISIRGRGSFKDGSKGRINKIPDEDDELHVHIQGETEEGLERACKMVQELLTPIDDEKNEHKQKQLKELALINGTLREEEYCQVCGEKGHRQFECPHRAKTFKAAGVVCSICGDLSHPTRDCPLKQDGPTNEVLINNEYLSFMSELGGKGQIIAPGGSEPLTTKPVPQVAAVPLTLKEALSNNTSGSAATPKQQTVVSVSYSAGMSMVANMNPVASSAPVPSFLPQATPLPSFMPQQQTYQPPQAFHPPLQQQSYQPPQPYWNPMTGQWQYPSVFPPMSIGYPPQMFAYPPAVSMQQTWDSNMYQQQLTQPPPPGSGSG